MLRFICQVLNKKHLASFKELTTLVPEECAELLEPRSENQPCGGGSVDLGVYSFLVGELPTDS